jgi:hypothetical protein
MTGAFAVFICRGRGVLKLWSAIIIIIIIIIGACGFSPSYQGASKTFSFQTSNNSDRKKKDEQLSWSYFEH